MVRIRHPNLFVDKRDTNWEKMPHWERNNLARVANSFLFFYAFTEESMRKTTLLFLASHFHGVLRGQIHWFWRHIGEI